MDRVEESDRLPDLVGLQRPDEMELDTGVPRRQSRPFGLGFLHAVFAERPLTDQDDRFDGVGAERL